MSNKLLIGVKSCCRDWMRGDHGSIERTWGFGLPPGVNPQHHPEKTHLQFFVGDAPCWLLWDDYITHLNVSDDYNSLTQKTLSILQWFLATGYDSIYLCDNDTFVRPEALRRSGYDKFDYAGEFGTVYPIGTRFDYQHAGRTLLKGAYPWASGGVGYFLSRRAAEFVVQNNPLAWPEDWRWAEDLWVGQVIGQAVAAGMLTACNLPEFECNVSWHFPKKNYGYESYDPKFQWLEEMEILHGEKHDERIRQYKKRIPIIGEKKDVDPLIEALDSGAYYLPAGRKQREYIQPTDEMTRNRIESAKRFRALPKGRTR